MQLRNRSLSIDLTNANTKGSFLIAVDLDDVLLGTNEAAAAWHNRQYGTKMTLQDFIYYHWWRNKFWGPPRETVEKVYQFYKSDSFKNAEPLKDAFKSLKKLQSMGCTFVIITARGDDLKESTKAAVERHFPGIFLGIDHTLATKSSDPEAPKPTKRERLPQLGAKMLIDDHLDTVVDCANAGIPTLLFGDYEWNKRFSSREEDRLSFAEKESVEGAGTQWWHKDDILDSSLPPLVQRVPGWTDAVQAVRQHLQPK
ncbi:hypothetical protein FRB96_003407 [Tulasnella sp. 330]|nr:hypothetical protein FRB96_003407 [Tulasnella sp. 330]KAG8882476.1 hypothetical protein FRB97_008205 [Tulasnella sp. 331]KAG8888117.1 hypothetical protein FRB98_008383 [Tulasnella sp. 332]